MKRELLVVACIVLVAVAASAAESPWDTHGKLEVSKNGRYLQHADGTPFFYLGDTAWELFHRLDREEADRYLEDRAAKGFTVIQAVALAELDGLNTPNPYGHRPLTDNDPARPAVKDGPQNDYWDHVDYIVDRAHELGMFIGMLPTWGDKWNKRWGVGPVVFTPENARAYGRFLGDRYKNKPIIWILGGDRIPEEDVHIEITRAMAKGIKEGDGGVHLMTFHPSGGQSSSKFFHKEEWLDFNFFQSGHGRLFNPNHEVTLRDRDLKPTKPVLDGEPAYEDHPVKDKRWNDRDKPGVLMAWFDDFDCRRTGYGSMLAGACGHTYGDHNIWQMWQPGRAPISVARTPWHVALDNPGSQQMGYMKGLFTARPFHRLVPDFALVRGDNPDGSAKIIAARADDGSFAIFYTPLGKAIDVDLKKVGVKNPRGLWFNPRQNSAQPITDKIEGDSHVFTPMGNGRALDWVLVIEDKTRDMPQIGHSAY